MKFEFGVFSQGLTSVAGDDGAGRTKHVVVSPTAVLLGINGVDGDSHQGLDSG